MTFAEGVTLVIIGTTLTIIILAIAYRIGSDSKKKDEEIWHLGYYPYIEVLKDVKELYKEGADAVELEMIKQEEFDLHMNLEQQIITPEEFDKQIRRYERI